MNANGEFTLKSVGDSTIQFLLIETISKPQYCLQSKNWSSCKRGIR